MSNDTEAHLKGQVTQWDDIYTKLSADFNNDGCGKNSIAIDALLAGDPNATPPTGLGYNRPGLDAFLDSYVNSKKGVARYDLQQGTEITADIVASSSSDPTVATLVNLIANHQNP